MLLRATSDLHLTQDNSQYVFAALQQLWDDTLNSGGGVTIILGDVFHRAETVHMPTWNRLRHMVQGWPGPIYLIAGNHDQFDEWANALEGMEGRSCVVVTLPLWTKFGRMLPYTHPTLFEKTLSGLIGCPVSDHPAPIVWCHHGFNGAYMNAMRRDRKGVPCSAIPDDHIVITGHYHLPQTLGRIIYTGSPFEHSFAEEGQQKGWLRWDDARKDPVPYRVAYEPTGAPRHVTIHWDPSDGFESTGPWEKGKDKLRIVTAVTRSVVKAHAKEIAAGGYEGIPILARADEPAGRGVVNRGATPQEAVRQYIDSVHGADLNLPSPSEMWEWAKEYELMAV